MNDVLLIYEAFLTVTLIAADNILNDLVPPNPARGRQDAVYIWMADAISYRDMPVYKIGVTSSVLLEYGDNPRANQVAKAHGYLPIIKIAARVAKAIKLEKKLLRLGVRPDIAKTDGHTEFRAMSDKTLNIALGMVEAAAIYTYTN